VTGPVGRQENSGNVPAPGAARDGTPLTANSGRKGNDGNYPAPNAPLQPKTPDQPLPRPMSACAP
jgi:hypothetical protein